jgi:lipopolysaccharide biosynthesis regulator YciM
LIPIDPLWLLVLPLLFAMGWFAARLELRQGQARQRTDFDELAAGVEALIEDNSEEAMNRLLAAIQQNPEALGLQKALGRYYRQKGLPDRAIEVHLALLGRTQLSDSLREQLVLELAHDYMAAGIFDRAEQSLDLLRSGVLAQQALALKLDLMQRQRRWADALSVAEQLAQLAKDPQAFRTERFHFLMELGQADRAAALIADHARLQAGSEPVLGLHVCGVCGFQTRRHYWQCPGCHSWDGLHPIQ